MEMMNTLHIAVLIEQSTITILFIVLLLSHVGHRFRSAMNIALLDPFISINKNIEINVKNLIVTYYRSPGIITFYKGSCKQAREETQRKKHYPGKFQK